MSQGRVPPGATIEEKAALTRRVSALAVGVATVLIVAKAAAWQASGSMALLASLTDSGLDLLASLATFFAVRYAAAPPDAEHRYGHGKAEAFSSFVQAALVLVSAALLGREAVVRIIDPRPIENEAWALGVMAFSMVLTALLISAQTRVERRTGSLAIAGDRAHYVADLASNLVVVVGVLGAALLDAPVLDPIAGVLVALWLVWTAFKVFRDSADHLMDRELSVRDREEIARLITETGEITNVHQMRTRASGPYVHIQAHMDLDPELRLDEAHDIGVAAERRVLARYPAADIILHPDPRGRAEEHGDHFFEQGDLPHQDRVR